MEYKIKDWKENKRNTLLGFATIEFVDIGLEIRGCTFHEKGGKRWVSLPAKPYQKEDNTKGWSYIIAFSREEEYWKFQYKIIEIFNKMLFIAPEVPDKVYFGATPPWELKN